MKRWIYGAMYVVLWGGAGAAGAEEIIGTPAAEPIVVTTGPVIQPSVQAAVPVAVPVDVHQRRDLVAWKRLEGTVQSIDRNNNVMTVQDRDGKDVRVVYNDRIRIYRNGEEIPYSDVTPNDQVVLRYQADRPLPGE